MILTFSLIGSNHIKCFLRDGEFKMLFMVLNENSFWIEKSLKFTSNAVKVFALNLQGTKILKISHLGLKRWIKILNLL